MSGTLILDCEGLVKVGLRMPTHGIELKTAAQLDQMREAGLVVATALSTLAEVVAPGITTAELDRIAELQIRSAGATPSFKGYQGYPATICTSVNDEVVHAIPGQRRLLARRRGYHGRRRHYYRGSSSIAGGL